MKDLIEALQILLKYGNPKVPFVIDESGLNLQGIDPRKINSKDRDRLYYLGVIVTVKGEQDANADYEEVNQIYFTPQIAKFL